jgi:hypothetical protein
MKLFKTMLLGGMGNIKKVKSVDPFQTLIDKCPYTILLPVDLAHPVHSPSAGPVEKCFRALGLWAETAIFTYGTIPAHNTLVGKKLTSTGTAK